MTKHRKNVNTFFPCNFHLIQINLITYLCVGGGKKVRGRKYQPKDQFHLNTRTHYICIFLTLSSNNSTEFYPYKVGLGANTGLSTEEQIMDYKK